MDADGGFRQPRQDDGRRRSRTGGRRAPAERPAVRALNLVTDATFDFLAFSPERVDPGDQQFNGRNFPKIVGGVGPASAEMDAALYGATVENVIKVGDTRNALKHHQGATIFRL
jgi:UDP-N-acetyl-D-mannosaminuronate dehydrogenase